MIKPLILPYKGIAPRIHPSCFIAENAVIIGDVEIGPDSNIWYGCVLRGDVNNITIGARTNIQDGTVIHVSSTTQGSYIGDDVTVGHMALIHACTIGNRVLVGMKSCIMDDAQVADEAIIAACALIPPRKSVPTRELWAGQPARLMRAVTDDDVADILHSATHYVDLANSHKKY